MAEKYPKETTPEKIQSKGNKTSDASSKSSIRTSRSSRSSVGVAAARARAKAEAARARVTFAEREIAIKVDTARLQANLEALHLEKEAAAASAEADILEAAAEYEDEEPYEKKSHSSSAQSTEKRVCDYVRDQATYLSEQADLATDPPHDCKSEPDQVTDQNQFTSQTEPNIVHVNDSQYVVLDACSSSSSLRAPKLQKVKLPRNIKEESIEKPVSNKWQQQCSGVSRYLPQHSETSDMMDLVKFLARRELVSSGLTRFDDRPESYRAWRSSFINTIKDLGLTASEELDLLSKWLGKESSEYVRRLRAVHIGNPDTALKMVWNRLDECYSSPEVIESALFKKLDSFPRISGKDNLKLRELGDLLMELLSAKEDGYLPGLAYLDTARGIRPIVEKLPYSLQEKWISQGSKFKEEFGVTYPPFSFFTQFMCNHAKTRNDPSFAFSSSCRPQYEGFTVKHTNFKTPVLVHKTEISHSTSQDKMPSRDEPAKFCPIHNKPHPLRKCRGFRLKTIDDRKAYLKEQGICFRCCSSSSHFARDCKVILKCDECNSDSHNSALHPGPPSWTPKIQSHLLQHGGEDAGEIPTTQEVSSLCTEVCHGLSTKSCSKICLVNVFPEGHPENAVKMYAMLDDQSNRSLARSRFFDIFNINSIASPYSLKTCAGSIECSGRKANGYRIKAANGGISLALPTLIECDEIPNNRDEIPTPEAALHQLHLKHIASEIPALDSEAHILLLLGRDILRVHKVRKQINGPNNTPFGQKLDLGWVLVGEVCLGDVHKPSVSSFKTNILENGRPSLFIPCTSHVHIKEKITSNLTALHMAHDFETHWNMNKDNIGQTLFIRSENDNKSALSIEDEVFLKIMEKDAFQDNSNSWVAPLPFRSPRPVLSNNREQALSRLSSLRRTLERKPDMKEQFATFMQKLFDSDHAELAAPLPKGKECWYLPLFGVYHPKKPDQIRVVFDSSAQHEGISLNNVLLTGPDLNNSLIGVLMRFRKECVAVMADIQQMFHCFVVREDHRDYLRFLWYRDNDLNKDIVEYRMKVHVFGNSPSPAVAIYCLRRAAEKGAPQHGPDTRHFVERGFYVDDALISLPTEEEAIDLLKRTQASLSESNLRLHKIVSNSLHVLKAFPTEDHAKEIKDLNLSGTTMPTQRSLGLNWETATDTFTFKVSVNDKPFTRRGVLSIINSLFDPLGLVAPVTIQGRFLLRELSIEGLDWDEPLPQEKCGEWETWRHSLKDLQNLHIPRPYTPNSHSEANHKEICVFSDASTKAIGAVAYLRAVDGDGQISIGFILGKAKLTPKNQPTIPRLELCAAVLAVEVAELIVQEIDFKPDAITFYCDSKIVLGYIYNETKRFYVYVHNRVQRIRQFSEPKQWRYIPTEHNPADIASRSIHASQLVKSNWFTGPAFLHKPHEDDFSTTDNFALVDPDSDTEIRPIVTACITGMKDKQLTSDRFQRFSSWKSLQRAIASLIHVACSFRSSNESNTCSGWHLCSQAHTVSELLKAKNVIIRSVQKESFSKDIETLSKGGNISSKVPLSKLNPFLDGDGLLRVGGRLKLADLSYPEKNPVILPGKHHVSALLIRHYHERVEHQGRIFTEGAIRAAGLWLIGGKRCINSILHACVTCRKLRGKLEMQKMSDLPPERLSVSPPFTYTGLDVFGPWTVVARRTRGGQALSKRWAVLFTCMSTRAVHIEVIMSMDSSSCINALRRFFAIRGPAKQLQSDCGTNFIGACNELEFHKVVKETKVQRYINSEGCTWAFNPPHSSHMGGAWERMIGLARRILDSMLMREGHSNLSDEVLCTLMAEVTAIINSRPLVPVSMDADSPLILTPAMLLTQKAGSPPPAGNFSEKDIYKRQWRQVQSLANQFWCRWKQEYLQTLQVRHKWQEPYPNIQEDDIVLLKDNQVARNEWPMALVTSVFPGQDGKVRKVELKVTKEGSSKTFLRPISEVILLLRK